MRHVTTKLMLAVCISAILVTGGVAQPLGVPEQARKEPTPGQWRKALVGGQLGPWFVNDLGNDISSPNVRLDASGTAFHLEFFYQPNIIGILNLEFSVGAINRGDLRIRGQNYDAFGNATLYPLSAGVILYPMAKRLGQQIQPLVKAGGSVVIGTEVYEITTAGYYDIASESRTTLGYYFGAGANLVFSPSFALTGMVKYQHARFDEELFEAHDYSGTQVLFGAAYMYR
jgi:hypothetical protein